MTDTGMPSEAPLSEEDRKILGQVVLRGGTADAAMMLGRSQIRSCPKLRADPLHVDLRIVQGCEKS